MSLVVVGQLTAMPCSAVCCVAFAVQCCSYCCAVLCCMVSRARRYPRQAFEGGPVCVFLGVRLLIMKIRGGLCCCVCTVISNWPRKLHTEARSDGALFSGAYRRHRHHHHAHTRFVSVGKWPELLHRCCFRRGLSGGTRPLLSMPSLLHGVIYH